MSEKKRSNFNSTIIIRTNVVSKSFISELIMIFIASSIECIYGGLVWLLNLSSFHFHRCRIIAKCSIFPHTVARLLPCTWNKRIKCINLLIYYRLWLICRIFMKINPFRLCNQFIKLSEKFNFNQRQFVSVQLDLYGKILWQVLADIFRIFPFIVVCKDFMTIIK